MRYTLRMPKASIAPPKAESEQTGLTILQVADLVKALESKWGISKAAPKAAAAGTPKFMSKDIVTGLTGEEVVEILGHEAGEEGTLPASDSHEGKLAGLVAEVATLRNEVLELKRQRWMGKRMSVPTSILPELHDERTGRIDAHSLAEFMGVPLKQLAEGLGLNYKSVHHNPSGPGFKEALQPVKRSLELLHEFFGPKETIRAWLNTPHPDLGGATSLATILEGKAFALVRILENARQGLPV